MKISNPNTNPIQARIDAIKLNFMRLPYFMFRSILYFFASISSAFVCLIEFIVFLLPMQIREREPWMVEQEEEVDGEIVLDDNYLADHERTMYHPLTPTQYFFREIRKRVHPYKKKNGSDIENKDRRLVPDKYLELFYNDGELLWKWEIGFYLRIVSFYIFYSLWGINFIESNVPSKRPFYSDVPKEEFMTFFAKTCLVEALDLSGRNTVFKANVLKKIQRKYSNTTYLFDEYEYKSFCNNIFMVVSKRAYPFYKDEKEYKSCTIRGAFPSSLFKYTEKHIGKSIKEELVDYYLKHIESNSKYWKYAYYKCYPNSESSTKENKIKAVFDYDKKDFLRQNSSSFDEYFHRKLGGYNLNL